MQFMKNLSMQIVNYFLKNLIGWYGNYQKKMLNLAYDVKGKSHIIDCTNHKG